MVARAEINRSLLIFSLVLYTCVAFSGGQIIEAGTLDVSAPPLLDWQVSVSVYGEAVLVSPDGVQILSLERIRYTADNSNHATVDYCYICVRPSGRPPGRVTDPDPDITWSSPCSQVEFVENCTLVFSPDGNLALRQDPRSLWQTDTAGKGVRSMQLDNSGNLLLLGTGNSDIVWQSFDRLAESDAFLACDQVAQTAYFLGSFSSPTAFIVSDYVFLAAVCIVGHIIFHYWWSGLGIGFGF